MYQFYFIIFFIILFKEKKTPKGVKRSSFFFTYNHSLKLIFTTTLTFMMGTKTLREDTAWQQVDCALGIDKVIIKLGFSKVKIKKTLLKVVCKPMTDVYQMYKEQCYKQAFSDWEIAR